MAQRNVPKEELSPAKSLQALASEPVGLWQGRTRPPMEERYIPQAVKRSCPFAEVPGSLQVGGRSCLQAEVLEGRKTGKEISKPLMAP